MTRLRITDQMLEQEPFGREMRPLA